MTKTLTQKQAHEILVRNNVFCGGAVPFYATTNYIGMLYETNLHRKLHGCKQLN
jgi:hypothetical protein